MQKIRLKRDTANEFGVFGILELESGDTFQTLEQKKRDNKPMISCIPHGNYPCSMTNSPRFGRVYKLAKVNNRQHILIHKGNKIEDTAGCILIGTSRTKTGISESKKAFDKFMKLTGGNEFELEIIDESV